jgi:hypothetical protein
VEERYHGVSIIRRGKNERSEDEGKRGGREEKIVTTKQGVVCLHDL